jgi:hypothetical protein
VNTQGDAPALVGIRADLCCDESAQEIDQYLENLSLEGSSLLSDLSNCAVGEIDCREIASHFGNE